MATETLVKRGDILHVPFTKLITIPGMNLPGRDTGIEELAESLYHNGARVPLKGYKDGENYVVIAGHRRFAAAQIVKDKYKKTIIFPFISYPKGTTAKDFILDHFLTNDGAPLTPLQSAVGVSRLMDEGMKVKDIATVLNFSEVYIANLKKLADAPKEAQDLVKKGIISSTLLISVLKNKKTGDISEFIAKAIALGEKAEQDAELEKKNKEQAQQDRLDRKKTKSKGGKVGKAKGTKAPGKKKTATVTAKNIKQDSFKEIKRFIKVTRDDMPFIKAETEIVYNFLRDAVDNKFRYDDLIKFFTVKK